MVWPGQLSNTSLLWALHDKSRSNPSKSSGWSVSRYRFFVYVMVGSFAWYWIPGVLWQGLSVFAFVTCENPLDVSLSKQILTRFSGIKPNNVVLNQLFGGFTGLSLIPLTFDFTCAWSSIKAR